MRKAFIVALLGAFAAAAAFLAELLTNFAQY